MKVQEHPLSSYMDSIIPLFSFSVIVYIFDYTAEPLGRPPRDGRPNLGNALHIRPGPISPDHMWTAEC